MARIGPGSCALNLHACTRDLVAPGSSGTGVRLQATLLRPLRQDDDGAARPSGFPGRRSCVTAQAEQDGQSARHTERRTAPGDSPGYATGCLFHGGVRWMRGE